MSTVIQINVTDQQLSITDSPLVASGGISEDVVKFTFDSNWDGFTKTAVFYRSENAVYHVVLSSANEATIPQEVLTDEGTLYIGVFGVSGSVTKTSELIKYRVKAGAITTGTPAPDPTPSVYAQIISRLGALETKAVAIPSGGTAGQVLQKTSSTDYATAWADSRGVPDYSASEVEMPYKYIGSKGVFKRTFTSTSVTTADASIGTLTGLERIIGIDGSIEVATTDSSSNVSTAYFPISYSNGSEYAFVKAANTDLHFYQNAARSIQKIQATIEYTKGLPAGYQLVEYIGTGDDSTLGIDTGIVPDNTTYPNLVVEAQFLTTARTTSSRYVYGIDTANGTSGNDCGRFNLRINASSSFGLQLAYNNSSGTIQYVEDGILPLSINSINTISATSNITGGKISFTDGTTTYEEEDYAPNNPIGSLLIFRTSSALASGANPCINTNVYHFKISNAGVVLRDMYPCYRTSDNVIGMYDVVNGKFYTNCVSGSTGTFIKGDDVNY